MKVVSFSLCLVWLVLLLLSSSIFIMCEAQDNNTDTTTTITTDNTTDTNIDTTNTTDTTTVNNDQDGDSNNSSTFEDQLSDDMSDEHKVWFNENFKRGTGNVLDGHFIVKFNETAADNVIDMINTTSGRATIQDKIDQLLNETGINMTHIRIRHKMERIFRGFSWQEQGPVINNPTLRYSILKRLLNHSLVEFIEQEQQVDTSSCTASWGLDRIDQKSLPMDGVYRHDWDGASVDVYVLDTGVHETHEQFEGRASCPISMVEDENCTDGNGHGTHVCGTVGGKDYGVAKKANIIGVKVLSNTGSGSNSGIISGMDWAVSQSQITGRKSIISMSLGGPGSSSAMDQAISNAVQEGVLVVVAAGNENQNACLFQPASSQFALAVGSIDMDDSRSSFSNYGSCVGVFAPGGEITSAWWTSDTATNTISGTSMATPHVSGIAALFWDEDPTLSVIQVMSKIIISDNATSVQNADGPENRDGIAITVATFVTGSTNTTTPPPPQDCHYSSARSALFVTTSLSQTFILALPMLMLVATFW